MNFGVTILIMNYFLGVESEMEHEWFISKKVKKRKEAHTEYYIKARRATNKIK